MPLPLLQLCQHCPAHAHCHVCCPSARRAVHGAPLGSGEAPAVRLRALATVLTQSATEKRLPGGKNGWVAPAGL